MYHETVNAPVIAITHLQKRMSDMESALHGEKLHFGDFERRIQPHAPKGAPFTNCRYIDRLELTH